MVKSIGRPVLKNIYTKRAKSDERETEKTDEGNEIFSCLTFLKSRQLHGDRTVAIV